MGTLSVLFQKETEHLTPGTNLQSFDPFLGEWEGGGGQFNQLGTVPYLQDGSSELRLEFDFLGRRPAAPFASHVTSYRHLPLVRWLGPLAADQLGVA